MARMVAPEYPLATNAARAASRIRRLVRCASAARRLDRYERGGFSSVKLTQTQLTMDNP
jgi:hypothetical protein